MLTTLGFFSLIEFAETLGIIMLVIVGAALFGWALMERRK